LCEPSSRVRANQRARSALARNLLNIQAAIVRAVLKRSMGRDMTQAVVTARSQSSAARTREGSSLALVILWIQIPYYLVTGVWPLLSIHTFQLVTGPKFDHLPRGGEADHWLVYAVGLLVTSVALALLVAAWRRSVQPEIAVLALGSAISLTAIDVIFVARQVIAPIYLVDAAIELPLIAGWIVVLIQQARSRKADQ
jgi:hypothetical protein